MRKLIVSLYDFTEAWSGPYIKAGYPVYLWDEKVEGDILRGFTQLQQNIEQAIELEGCYLHGILAAPPCTAFAVSGAQWWPKKDAHDEEFFPFDSFTELHVALVEIVLHLVDIFKPTFWVIENPVGRIEKLVPAIAPFRKMSFNPCDYGDPYTKKTILWGDFNAELPRNDVFPLFGSMMHNVAPGPNRQAIRSATPKGFSNAFFLANQ